MIRKIIVTGGAGFIGSHVAELLAKCENHEVHVLDDLSGGYIENVPKKCKFHYCNLIDTETVNALFNIIQPHFVFHLAAYAAEGMSHFIRKFNYESNVLASVNVINNCINHKVQYLVFTSSMAVYGNQHEKLPFTEDLTPKPCDPYGIAKYSIEQDIKCAHDLYGLSYSIIRPHNVAGPRQNFYDSYRNVVGIFVRQAMNNEPLTIFGDGCQVRAFSHIDDVAHPIVDCINLKGFHNKTFNVGGDKTYDILQLAEEVKRVVNPNVDIKFLPPRHEVHTAFCDHEKLREFYVYHSRKDLTDIITELYEWAKTVKHGKRFFFRKDQIEVSKHLPPSWEKELL